MIRRSGNRLAFKIDPPISSTNQKPPKRLSDHRPNPTWICSRSIPIFHSFKLRITFDQASKVCTVNCSWGDEAMDQPTYGEAGGVGGKESSSGAEAPGLALDHAHRRLRDAARRIQPVARIEGWPTPFSPVRFLILHHLISATAFGLTPRRLGMILDLKASTLSYHLEKLEAAGLIHRRPRALGDGRKVGVRLTAEGTFAARRLESVLSQELDEPPSELRLGPEARESWGSGRSATMSPWR